MRCAAELPHIIARLLALGLLCSNSLACTSDAERVQQGQVARIAEHIERLRRADNQTKREPLAALAALPCPNADACGLQDLCLRAYRLHQSALDAIALLEQLARDPSPPPPDTAERLARAQTDLAQAKTLSETCAEQQVRVVRKALIR